LCRQFLKANWMMSGVLWWRCGFQPRQSPPSQHASSQWIGASSLVLYLANQGPLSWRTQRPKFKDNTLELNFSA
jgi:hypothetical protein